MSRLRVSTDLLQKGSFMVLWGGQLSRCVKCDDDLTILEIIYEDRQIDCSRDDAK